MYIHQISLQSLEAIVRIGAKSVGRISQCCMHVCMQIQGAAVCYTLPSTHRRFPPRPTCSLLCSDLLGARITQMAPPISHSKTLDKFLCPTPPLASTFNGYLFFTETTCAFLTLLPLVVQLRNQIVAGAVPRHPDVLAPLAVVALSHTFWRLSKTASTNPSTTCKLPYKIHTTKGNIRSHRQVGKRTVTHANTLQQRAAHNSQ